jgi:uncharacterized membrane protein YtjA (UPF0391 family)
MVARWQSAKVPGCQGARVQGARGSARVQRRVPEVLGTVLAAASIRRCTVLYWAFMFLLIGLVAAVLGFTNIAGGAFAIAKFLAGLFLVLFLIFLVLGMTAAKKIVG